MPTNRKSKNHGGKSKAVTSQMDLIPDHAPEPNRDAKHAHAKINDEPEPYTPSPDDPNATVPATREELGARIFGKRDVAQVLSDVLRGHGDPKLAAIRLRACHAAIDILFGKAGAGSAEGDVPPPADWDGIPGPDRETP